MGFLCASRKRSGRAAAVDAPAPLARETQELPVGGFASVPPNHPHYAWVGGAGTVVQVHGVGPTDLRFVNPEDDPRSKK